MMSSTEARATIAASDRWYPWAVAALCGVLLVLPTMVRWSF